MISERREANNVSPNLFPGEIFKPQLRDGKQLEHNDLPEYRNYSWETLSTRRIQFIRKNNTEERAV